MPTETFFNLPDDKRQRIMALALEEFATHDYAQASLSKIVARAGIAKGSAYQYFADKLDLYRHVIDQARQQKTAFMVERGAPPADSSTFAFLRWLMREGAGFDLAHPLLAQLARRAMHANSPLSEELRADGGRATRAYFESLVAHGIKRGDLRKDLDVTSAAFVFAAVFGELGEFLAEAPAKPSKRRDTSATLGTQALARFERVMDALENGMRAPSGKQS